MERVSPTGDASAEATAGAASGTSEDADDETGTAKLSTSKLAAKLKLKTPELLDKLTAAGLLELNGDRHQLTAKGKEVGGEFKRSPRFGPYFVWPENFNI